MFSLEHELLVREQKLASYDSKVAELVEKEKAYLDAKAEVDAIGDTSELVEEIKVIKGYLGIKDEVVVESVEQPTEEIVEAVAETVVDNTVVEEIIPVAETDTANVIY